MYKGNKILALIPARAGSKGVRNKNTRLLRGKPLIAWSIEQALGDRYIDKVVVSTESQLIASIARRYGADVPFLRPPRLSTSSAKMIDVIFNALSYFDKARLPYDIIVLLQPTSPLRKSDDIKRAIEAIFVNKAKAIVSVCKEPHSPLWCTTIASNNKIGTFLKKGAEKQNRQGLPVFYRINGAVYVAQVDYVKQNKGFFGNSTYAYIMPPERSIDIDDEFDFKIATLLKK